MRRGRIEGHIDATRKHHELTKVERVCPSHSDANVAGGSASGDRRVDGRAREGARETDVARCAREGVGGGGNSFWREHDVVDADVGDGANKIAGRCRPCASRSNGKSIRRVRHETQWRRRNDDVVFHERQDTPIIGDCNEVPRSVTKDSSRAEVDGVTPKR